MTTPALIQAEDITFGYRYDKLVLNGVSLSVPQGARIALVGPNGAGKSTLFLQFNAILRPTSGKLLFRGSCYKYDKQFISQLRQKVGRRLSFPSRLMSLLTF